MVTINIYRSRTYYVNKYGDKCYADEDSGGTYVKAALLTGKGLESEEQLIYSAHGESKKDADKALKAYMKVNDLEDFEISRKEVI